MAQGKYQVMTCLVIVAFCEAQLSSFFQRRREVDGGHKRGRICSLTFWCESDRIGRSGMRTDDISAGGKIVFIDMGGQRTIPEFVSFRNLFLKKTSLMVNKLLPVLARKCFILCYRWR